MGHGRAKPLESRGFDSAKRRKTTHVALKIGAFVAVVFLASIASAQESSADPQGWAGALSRGWRQGTAEGLMVEFFFNLAGRRFSGDLDVGGSIPILPGLSMRWDCGLSPISGMFASGGTASEKSLWVASTEFVYRISESLRGSVGYAHRASGPEGAALLTYRWF